jgi:hypothetical protein
VAPKLGCSFELAMTAALLEGSKRVTIRVFKIMVGKGIIKHLINKLLKYWLISETFPSFLGASAESESVSSNKSIKKGSRFLVILI